jgi:hypothetical protein
MKILLRLLSKLGGWAQSKLNTIERREAIATALSPGFLVTLEKCRCPYEHSGLWVVDRYDPEAGDYRIVRMADGKPDYARRDVMTIAGFAPEDIFKKNGKWAYT